MNGRRLVLVGVASMLVVSSVAGLGLALSSAPAPLDVGTTDDGAAGDIDPGTTADADLRMTADAGPGALPDRSGEIRSPSSAGENGSITVAQVVARGDRPRFASAKKQVIRGESDLPTGTDLQIVIVTGDEDDWQMRWGNTFVQNDGTFRETVDLRSIPPGTTARLYVLHNGTRVVDRTVDVVEAHEDTELESDWNRVYATPGRETFEGTTDLPAGTEVTVTVHAAGEPSFERQRTVTVRSDGTFRARFDLDPLSHGDNFRVSVSHDGTRLDYATGLVLD